MHLTFEKHIHVWDTWLAEDKSLQAGCGFDVLTSFADCIAILGGLKHLLFLSCVGEMIQFD